MFKLERGNRFHRSYILEGRELRQIVFYNENGIVLHSAVVEHLKEGWLYNPDGTDAKDINVDLELRHKRKFKPELAKKNIVQLLHIKGDYFGNAILYLPYGAFKWELLEIDNRDYEATREIYEKWLCKDLNVVAWRKAETQEIEGFHEFIKEITPLTKLITYREISQDSIFKNQKLIKAEVFRLFFEWELNKDAEKMV